MPSWLQIFKKCLHGLSSMQASWLLLIVIAILSSLGTLIPQDYPSDFYMTQYGSFLGPLILITSLDNLYYSPWFIACLVLLGLSLITCCIKQIKMVRSMVSLSSLALHMSIVIVLAGAFISMAYKTTAFIELPEGDKAELSAYGFKKGFLQVNQIKVDYYDNNKPRQYRTVLTLDGLDEPACKQEISVNHPLKHKLIKVYQSSWGWITESTFSDDQQEFQVNLPHGDKLTLPHRDYMVRAFFIPDFQDGMYSKSPWPNNPRLLLTLYYQEKMVDMAMLAVGESAKLGQYSISFNSYRQYSGITVKQDPGIPVVFTGFMLLLAGLGGRYVIPAIRRRN
jgi:cytochrome c biogenesis protein